MPAVCPGTRIRFKHYPTFVFGPGITRASSDFRIQLPKLRTRVRFSSPAPGLKRREQLVNSRLFIDVLPSCFFLIFPWSSFIWCRVGVTLQVGEIRDLTQPRTHFAITGSTAPAKVKSLELEWPTLVAHNSQIIFHPNIPGGEKLRQRTSRSREPWLCATKPRHSRRPR